jgi:large subunit ribosomal protein L29
MKMAIIKIKQIKEMTKEDITKKVSEMRLELFKEMGNVKMGRPIKNSGRIRELRRTISKLLTVKRENARKEVKK